MPMHDDEIRRLWDTLVLAVLCDDALRARQIFLRLRTLIDADWQPTLGIR